jgi:Uncharacterised nucleotidyltransferase
MSTAAQPRLTLLQVWQPTSVITSNPEFDLLVACCASKSSSSYTDRVRQLLSSQMNWNRWLSLVDHHRVVPQAYGALAVLRKSVPNEIFHALQSRYQDNARKTLWFTGELIRIVDHLKSKGIVTLPYKGPVLAQTLYSEVTQRQFGDLDILVQAADISKAKIALSALGYTSGIQLMPRQERDYIRSGYEYSFRGTQAPHLLELQWEVLPRFYSVDFNVASFFDRATETRVGGRDLPTLCASDLLLVLCAHAAKHVWIQLSWLCDIAQLTSSPRLDWSAIHNEARRLGIERILCLNLLLANQLLGSAIPSCIQEQIPQDTTTNILADEIRPIIERSQHYDTESISYFRLMMRLREHRRDRARFFTRLSFTPGLSEWSTIRLPESLSPLYRLIRLSRLATRLASACWVRFALFRARIIPTTV